jgi:hypothetical protein
MFIQSIIFLQFFGLISSVSIEEFVRPDLSFRGLIDYVHSFGLIPGSNFSSLVPLDKRYKFPPKLFRSITNEFFRLEYETVEDGQHEEIFENFTVSFNDDVNVTICGQRREIRKFHVQIKDRVITASPIILHTCTVTYGMPHNLRPLSSPLMLLFTDERITNLSGFPVFHFNIDGKIFDSCLCEEIQQTLDWIDRNSPVHKCLFFIILVFVSLMVSRIVIVSTVSRFLKWYRRNQVHSLQH